MAGYDSDWQDWSDWQGGSGGSGGWSRELGGGGYRPDRGEGPYRDDQPWASRRPRTRSYRTGYDFGYQGGEWGRPVNAPGFGTRGSYGPPEGRAPRGWGRRGGAFDEDYGRDYVFGASRGGASRGYLRGRGTEYGAEFGDVASTRGVPGRGVYGGDYDRALGRPRGPMGSGDFGGRADRHYGRRPVDPWPARAAARPDARMDDDDILDSVRENLFQDSFINPDRIEVAVDRGVVTLRGDVDDFLQARYAWDDAWESPGVRGVINNLTVRTDRASDEMDMPQTE